MKTKFVGGLLALALLAPAVSAAQVRVDRWNLETTATPAAAVESAWGSQEAAPAKATTRSMRASGHPWLRTVATVVAATGGYALAEELSEPTGSDVRFVPIAAGAGAAAVAGLIFSNAHPLKVIAGSALSALPGAALSTFLAGSLEAEEEGQIPLIAFSIPQGLFTSAFSQDRR